MSNLNIINFSDGIRSEEIQENFEKLEKEINRERINIGGPGVASGLNITPIVDETNFAIKISEASIITKTGEEIYIEEQIISIPRPYLTEQCEYLVADKENKVTLNEIPYSLNRKRPVQYSDSFLPTYSGINIRYTNSTSIDDGIRVKDISNTTLILTGLIKRSLEVRYYSTAKRIDTVYIDENNQIQISVSSITSTTPSAILPNNYKYLIAYLEVDSIYTASNLDTPHAYITVKEDLRSMRNIYTDINGQLYLKGVSFDDLQLIATKEPLNPKENQLWLNQDNNTLYIYKKVNNYSYIKTLEVTTQFTDGDSKDYTTDITYKVGKNELSVYINNEQLSDTEYTEMFASIPASEQIILDNTHSNVFRIYKTLKLYDKITYKITYKESEMIWVPINKETFVNTKEVKIYGINEEWDGGNYWTTEKAVKLGTDENGYPLKYKIFLFDYIEDKKMLFTPNRNEVEIIVNQMPLHKDQYIELTLGNLSEYINDTNILFDNYNWNLYEVEKFSQEEANIGIGIALLDPLDSVNNESITTYPTTPVIDWNDYISVDGLIKESDLCVEIRVNKSVSNLCSKRILQRAATYVNEESIEVIDTNSLNVNIKKGFYRYGENQLEVFLNGNKLINKKHYEEGTDIGEPDVDKLVYADYIDEYYSSEYLRKRGNITRRFTLKTPLSEGDVITYRITSTYYSYDHINSLLDEIDLTFEECISKISILHQDAVELNDSTIAAIQDMKNEISSLIGNNTNLEDKFLTRSSIIDEDQIDSKIINRIPQSIDFINCKIQYSGVSTIDITSSPYDIRSKDYITVIRRDNTNTSNSDKFLIRDLDYVIQDSLVNNVYFKTYIILKDSFLPNINNGDFLIISGIRFERGTR